MQAAINTIFAAAAGGFVAVVMGVIKDFRSLKDRIISVELFIGGMLAGCAAVSSGAPFYDQVNAAFVGGGAGGEPPFVFPSASTTQANASNRDVSF